MAFDSHNFFHSFTLVERIKMVFGLETELINKLLSSGFIFNFNTLRFESKYILKHNTLGDIDTELVLYRNNHSYILFLQHKNTSYYQKFEDIDIPTLLINFHLNQNKLENLHLIIQIKENYNKLKLKNNFDRYTAVLGNCRNIKSYYGDFVFADNTYLYYTKMSYDSYHGRHRYKDESVAIRELDYYCLEDIIEFQNANLAIPEKKTFKNFIEDENNSEHNIELIPNKTNDLVEDVWDASTCGISRTYLTEEDNNLNQTHFYGQ